LTGFRVIIGNRQAVKLMNEPFESFLTEVLALEGEDENAIREGVRVALADYEQVFRAQEVNKQMMVQGGSRLRFWIFRPLIPLGSRKHPFRARQSSSRPR
jgi:hypothetical protein